MRLTGRASRQSIYVSYITLPLFHLTYIGEITHIACLGLRKCQSMEVSYSSIYQLTSSSMISIALSSDYAMNALLAFSASHLAWQTKNPDTEHLSYHHSGIATKALQEALTAFSEHASEAVLATAMLLSWQAKDWYVRIF